jgi:hypothetical protein
MKTKWETMKVPQNKIMVAVEDMAYTLLSVPYPHNRPSYRAAVDYCAEAMKQFNGEALTQIEKEEVIRLLMNRK